MSSPKYNRFGLQNPECGVDCEKLSQSTPQYAPLHYHPSAVSAIFRPAVEGLRLEFLCPTDQLTIMSHLHDELCLGFQLLLFEDQLRDYIDALTALATDHLALIDHSKYGNSHTFTAGMTCYPHYIDGEWVDGQLMVTLFLGDPSGERIDISTLTSAQSGFDTSNTAAAAYAMLSWFDLQQYVTWLQSIHQNLPAYREHYLTNSDTSLIEATALLRSQSGDYSE